jgi:son of sevenless-like protein
MSESDMTGSYTSSLHSARTLNGFEGTKRENGREHAGFGVPKRAGTPEPWVRRLTDDGQTYFYYNKITGERKWTLLDTPISGNGGNPFTSMASNSSVSLSTATSDTSAGMMSRATSDTSPIRKDRDSVYSDGSDIMPNGGDSSFGLTPLQRSIAEAKKNGGLNFSMAEQAALALQEAMSPQTVRDLTGEVQKAIGVVIDRARHADLWNPQQMASMTACVTAVVKSVRNLLYIAALPSGTIPLDIMKDGSESRITAVQSVQAQLKPAQRKVTATLSKLVLSTRAYHSDVGTSPGDAASRLEQDALELDKALQAFVQDVQRYQRHSRLGTKRVFGAFSPDYLGLGVYGGGAAASWKGFGFVVVNAEEDVPKQPFGVEAVVWLKQSADQLSAQIAGFGDLLTNPEKVTGMFYGMTSTMIAVLK